MGKSDIYLGGVKFCPDFESASDRIVDEWLPLTGGSGQINMQITFKRMSQVSDAVCIAVIYVGLTSLAGDTAERGLLLPLDCRWARQLRQGPSPLARSPNPLLTRSPQVFQARKLDTGRIYALKTIQKAHLVETGEVTHTLAERTVLAQVHSPFIVPLKFSFQTKEKLYLVLAFVNGGELFHHLQREQRFNEERARFYAAELLCALEHLHDFNVVYRDLKPENILLDYTGHIALCDFGLCKFNMTDEQTTNTFCGTPEYLAPELLLHRGYTKTVDWWTLGILLFEMMGASVPANLSFLSDHSGVAGLPPFYDENTPETYRKILYDPLVFPEHMSAPAKSVLTALLTRDPSKRLGARGAQEIRAHPFFSGHLDWEKLLAKKIRPPFKPSVVRPPRRLRLSLHID